MGGKRKKGENTREGGSLGVQKATARWKGDIRGVEG